MLKRAQTYPPMNEIQGKISFEFCKSICTDNYEYILKLCILKRIVPCITTT